MMKVVLIALLLGVVLAKPTPIPYGPCKPAPKKQHITIKSVEGDPWPPKKGQNMEIHIKGTLDEKVTDGNFSADVYYLGMKIYSTTGKICEQKDVKCPIEAGDYDMKKDFTFPDEAPSGTYNVQAYATDQNSESLTCLTMNVTVSSPRNPWGAVADDDHWSQIAHDCLKGFFQGLNRDGKDMIDHLNDPTKYLLRDDLYNFLMALKGVKDAPKQIERYVAAFQASSKLLAGLQQAVVAVGDIKDSQKMAEFIAHFKNFGEVKQLLLPLLVDPIFHQDIRELVQVFQCVKGGECVWSDLGLKLGELIHTIISHA